MFASNRLKFRCVCTNNRQLEIQINFAYNVYKQPIKEFKKNGFKIPIFKYHVYILRFIRKNTICCLKIHYESFNFQLNFHQFSLHTIQFITLHIIEYYIFTLWMKMLLKICVKIDIAAVNRIFKHKIASSLFRRYLCMCNVYGIEYIRTIKTYMCTILKLGQEQRIYIINCNCKWFMWNDEF